MKDNRERPRLQDAFHLPGWFMSVIGDRGTYQEPKFEDDAQKIIEFYRDNGYIRANVGVPELKVIADSEDKKTRWIELRSPDHGRAALQGRHVRRGRQHGRQIRLPGAAVQNEAGRVLRGEEYPQRPGKGA